MAATRIARLLTSGVFLAGAAGLLVLDIVLALHGPGTHGTSGWLVAWGLLATTALPVGALVLVALTLARGGMRRSATVPPAGCTIPGSGQ